MAITIDGSTGGYTGPGMPDITRSNFQKQPETNNLLNTNYFKLVLGRLPTVSYMCQSVTMPGFSIGVADQSTALGLRQRRAGDTYTFDDFTVSFVVDENMDNWTEMFNWLVGIANYQNNIPLSEGGPVLHVDDHYSDARIMVTNSAYKPVKEIIIRDMIPTSLSGWEFTSLDTDSTPVVATATFAFSSMNIMDYPSQKPGDIVNLFTPPDR